MTIYKAAILPFSIINNDIVIYLCQLHGTWIKSSHLFSDFGGKIDVNESVIDAAVREFIEEGLDCFPNLCFDSVKKKLINKDYFACITTPKYITNKKPNNKKENHVVTYLIEIPFTKNIDLLFKNKKQILKSYTTLKIDKNSKLYSMGLKHPALIYDTTTEKFKIKSCYNETSSIRIFSINKLMQICNNVDNDITFLKNTRNRLKSILTILMKYKIYFKNKI